MTDFLTSSGRDAILQDMYSAHNCTPLAASAAAGMGRERFKKEQKRREAESGQLNCLSESRINVIGFGVGCCTGVTPRYFANLEAIGSDVFSK